MKQKQGAHQEVSTVVRNKLSYLLNQVVIPFTFSLLASR
jgi:hypothetical protein